MFSVPIALSLSRYHMNEITWLYNPLKPSSWAKCIRYSSMLYVSMIYSFYFRVILHWYFTVCMYVYIPMCLYVHLQRDIWAFSSFRWSWIMVSLAFVYSLYMNISFHFYNKITGSCGNFLKELPGYFSEYLCHFVLLPAMYENSLCILIGTWYYQ